MEKARARGKRAREKIPSHFIIGQNLHFSTRKGRHLDARVEVRAVSDVNFVACKVKPLS